MCSARSPDLFELQELGLDDDEVGSCTLILCRSRLIDGQLSFVFVLVCLQVLVHLVDVNTHQLVHALLVCTEARLPQLHRQLEVSSC
jgi:hypothetical protein